MKVIIPVAGLGSRLKPHTFTTPKPLMQVAGKPIIKYVLDDIKTLNPDEITLVVGYHKEQVKKYVTANYSDLNFNFVSQSVMDGDGGAVRVGLDSLVDDDELYVIFGADTLIDFNLKKELKKANNQDSIIFSMQVEEPSHYGILNIDANKNVLSVEEKPLNPKSNLAIIGAYYFKSALKVKNLLNDFYKNKQTIKGEYKLVQVLDSYISDSSLSVSTTEVSKWFDCGRPEVLLDANKYFLEKYSRSNKVIKKGNSLIIPPVYISDNVILDRCIVGPNVSISKDCRIKNSMIKNSIIGDSTVLEEMSLDNSLIGKSVYMSGKASSSNVGDRTEMKLN